MKIQAIRPRMFLLLATVSLLADSALAAAKAGSPMAIDPEVRSPLIEALGERGYFGDGDLDRELKLAIPAYLWDNRAKLASTSISKEREVDLVICLLQQAKPKLAELAKQEPLLSWCPRYVQTPHE